MGENKFEEAIKFYGDNQRDASKCTALSVQYTKKEKTSELTVNVEMAKIIDSSADWANKIYLQLSKDELTGLCELLFGLRKTLDVSYHGTKKNKGLKVHNNDAKGVMLIISEGGTTIHHMLSHNQRIELGVFIIRRQAAAWQISVSDVLAVLRQSVAISRIS
ncbi:hypothetical protein [Providencia sp. CIM-Carb-044]|uniref:hypothetical protein n=1 Tax=Providencia sp. CIM-Carb-044 TaxID=3096048 RepID=UPI0024AC5E9A|nr:hypothetical protein [Providencia sp. CIM-Carb-044]MCK9789627.1 hypothetical protein [Providencia rettgeri]MDX7426013.1 hypothetical protein [Providencia sp. CIM-Carb-044]